ncbi:unnamed protein product [Callosobruchus maculatus]|uniref:Uncharacterized protein n=1 Tax=Callosobruchus maculatus TaxID=64391 RepID=A0A653BK48_CALMS|nr:unnamed protein product [Callosobruchus maculatus]
MHCVLGHLQSCNSQSTTRLSKACWWIRFGQILPIQSILFWFSVRLSSRRALIFYMTLVKHKG